MRCFYSHSFRVEDGAVVDWFRQFLQAFPAMEVIEAMHDCPPPLRQVEKLVAEAELFCALVTGRMGTTPPWVSNELGMALAGGKVIFAFVEEAISPGELGCLPATTAYLKFDRQRLGEHSPAYVRYILRARNAVLKARHEDRASLLEQIGHLTEALKRFQELEERQQDEDEERYNDGFVG